MNELVSFADDTWIFDNRLVFSENKIENNELNKRFHILLTIKRLLKLLVLSTFLTLLPSIIKDINNTTSMTTQTTHRYCLIALQ